MSAMALPGPWSWNARGGRSERARRPWDRHPADAHQGPHPHPHPHEYGHEHGGDRAQFGPPPPPPPPGVPPGGGPWGGAGFPFGGPFGGFGHGPGGHRGGRGDGRRARRGDVRTGILLLIAEEPRSGYEIIREGRDRSGGMWRPSPGSVYPMLQQLEDEGLVAQEEGEGRRRPYRLTEEGIAYLDENGAGLTPPWEAGADARADSRSRYEEIGGLAYQLAAAAAQVAQAGTDDQLDRAKRLLAETRRNLYLILAEEDTAPEPDPEEDAGL
ncbi:PadR family transcriptional regulator [Nocardiopsis tropica]|uniref:PadR family transcriptional regulator n=2 Tax=Nocardiopsis tropica TaxID=109330 RepID=A0ABU7KTJ2_9ACTN|nr:PadR family transcriptional regulator [Nocardiopsis umidischolae]MEE2052319.1 PadR family transcriptional regulator [Nocardiopsis umidischolae]